MLIPYISTHSNFDCGYYFCYSNVIMQSSVDFFYDGKYGICLRLNGNLEKSIDTLNQICSALKPVSGKISIDGKEVDWETGKYEYLARINIDWIKSKFQVEDRFITWWKFCIEKQLIGFISNNVVRNSIKGFIIEYDKDHLKYYIELPVELTEEEFYRMFLMIDNICSDCWFYYAVRGNYSCYTNHIPCKNAILQSLYNLYDIGDDIEQLYTTCDEQRKITNELSTSQQATQAQLDKFEKFHRNEYAHMRTDFESCATLINKNTEKQKTYCEETNLLISDLQDRIVKIEFLLSGNVNYKLIDEAIEMPKKPIATTDMITTLEQTIADQKQMIDELRDELKKQHDEFEAYKLQKQRQLAAIMM